MTIGEQLNATADAMDALLTYANGITGAADTNIGDAVKTLADGYGQGGGDIPGLKIGAATPTDYVKAIEIPLNASKFLGGMIRTNEINIGDTPDKWTVVSAMQHVHNNGTKGGYTSIGMRADGTGGTYNNQPIWLYADGVLKIYFSSDAYFAPVQYEYAIFYE